MTNDKRLKLEMTVCRAAIKAGLDAGLVVSVYDGGEWVVKKSRKITQIVAALRSTSDDRIVFRDPKTGERKGSMYFVYGNMPYEVINDYSDNETMDKIYKAAEVVANRIEARC